MRRASFAVIPSLDLSTSPLRSPFSVMCFSSEPLRPYLFGFARYCMMRTTSDISISPSQFASPYLSALSSGLTVVVVVVSVEVTVVVVDVDVEVEVEVVVDVVVSDVVVVVAVVVVVVVC